MSKFTHKEYQNLVFKSIGLDPALFPRADQLWWQNPTNPYSLRLTSVGYEWFTKRAGITPYDIKLPKDQRIFPQQLLQLERQVTQPYYIKNLSNIAVFSEVDAMMLQLHAGDLATYLKNLSE